MSGPAFKRLPFRPVAGQRANQFAAFSATRSGVWAGYSANWGDFNVLRWSKSRGLKIIDHFRYGGGISNGAHGYVDISGITPSGAIVAAVSKGEDKGSRGLYWVNGKRHALSANRSWIDVHPVRVVNNGAILGWAQRSDRSYRLVRWAGPRAAYQSVRALPNKNIAVDAAGDVAWAQGSNDIVRLASGHYRTLATPDGTSVDMTIGGDHDVYSAIVGLYRWNLASPPASGPIPGSYVTSGANNVNATRIGSGRIIIGSRAVQHVLMPNGSTAKLPAQPSSDFPGQAIGSSGVIAVTAKSDGLPHFVTCH